MRTLLFSVSMISVSLAGVGCSHDRNAVNDINDARTRLQELAGDVVRYAAAHPSPPRLPISSSEWTPPGRACDHDDRRLPADPGAWQLPPWKDLQFSVGATAWQFRVLRTGSGPREQALLEARADRDCDGVPASLLVVVDTNLHVSAVQSVREDE